MSFQQALSGLNGASSNLDVIGNNIANANTYGSKESRAEFSDMYANALSGSSGVNIGIGTHLATVSQQFTQGNITTTGNAMDLAINGGGFFELSDGVNPTVYSRNGQFKVDANGNVVNNQGLKLMGYAADNTGMIQPGQAAALQLPTAGVSPNPTGKIDLQFNLDARLNVPAAAATPTINFADATTYNNATSVTAYDAKGQPVALTYYFQKSATDQWNVYATANGTTVGGTAASPAPITTLAFNSNGTTPTPSTMTLNIPASTNASGAATLAIPNVALNFGGSTEFGSGFGVTNLSQDGFAAGSLTGMVVDAKGVLTANYSNGQTKPVGQLEMATFRDPQGLQAVGGNGWHSTSASGSPIVGAPGQGNLGVIQAGALEESNVDLTAELVNMITAQRDYQANAQTIKTEDQVMQTLVSLR